MRDLWLSGVCERRKLLAPALLVLWVWSGYAGAAHNADLDAHSGDAACEYCVAFWSAGDGCIPGIAGAFDNAYPVFFLRPDSLTPLVRRAGEACVIRGPPRAG
jgi:hypothetical protein